MSQRKESKMSDPIENIRREMVKEINSKESEREAMEREHGQVWNTKELQEDFSVMGFMAPFVVVTRKSDGKSGSMMFQHSPRYYFGFKED